MLDTHIVRCDPDGRLVLPAEFRRHLNVARRAYFSVGVQNGSIIVTPVVGFVTANEEAPVAILP